MLAPATLELEQRITHLFGTRDVTPQDRTSIREHFGPDATWDTLPLEIRDLIEENEQLPSQAWDDPSEVPDAIFDDAAEPDGESDTDDEPATD